MLLYTSGTTGRPKGAELTHLQLTMNSATSGALFSFGPDDVSLAVVPFFHVYGLSLIGISVRYASTITVLPRFEPHGGARRHGARPRHHRLRRADHVPRAAAAGHERAGPRRPSGWPSRAAPPSRARSCARSRSASASCCWRATGCRSPARRRRSTGAAPTGGSCRSASPSGAWRRASSTSTTGGCPAAATRRGDRPARAQRHEGLLQEPGGDRRGPARRLAAHR